MKSKMQTNAQKYSYEWKNKYGHSKTCQIKHLIANYPLNLTLITHKFTPSACLTVLFFIDVLLIN